MKLEEFRASVGGKASGTGLSSLRFGGMRKEIGRGLTHWLTSWRP